MEQKILKLLKIELDGLDFGKYGRKYSNEPNRGIQIKFNTENLKKKEVLKKTFNILTDIEHDNNENKIKVIAAIIVPLLKGSPTELTKNTSEFPKKASVRGSNNLKINNNIATEIKLAIINPLTVNSR